MTGAVPAQHLGHVVGPDRVADLAHQPAVHRRPHADRPGALPGGVGLAPGGAGRLEAGGAGLGAQVLDRRAQPVERLDQLHRRAGTTTSLPSASSRSTTASWSPPPPPSRRPRCRHRCRRPSCRRSATPATRGRPGPPAGARMLRRFTATPGRRGGSARSLGGQRRRSASRAASASPPCQRMASRQAAGAAVVQEAGVAVHGLDEADAPQRRRAPLAAGGLAVGAAVGEAGPMSWSSRSV